TSLLPDPMPPVSPTRSNFSTSGHIIRSSVRGSARFSVVDPGFVVDLGVYSAPDQPHSPNPPRSLGEKRHRRTLRNVWAHQYHGEHEYHRESGEALRGGPRHELRGREP